LFYSSSWLNFSEEDFAIADDGTCTRGRPFKHVRIRRHRSVVFDRPPRSDRESRSLTISDVCVERTLNMNISLLAVGRQRRLAVVTLSRARNKITTESIFVRDRPGGHGSMIGWSVGRLTNAHTHSSCRRHSRLAMSHAPWQKYSGARGKLVDIVCANVLKYTRPA